MPRRRRPPTGRRAEVERGALYPTLDLHGETAESARRAAGRWLAARAGEGERVVRLITGRGKHSRGAPVLREEIGDLLRELTGAIVARVQEESGGGAFRVELRSAADAGGLSSARTRRPAAAPSVPPELRRAAEEALAELGVDPTPELLEVEIRRIRSERQGQR